MTPLIAYYGDDFSGSADVMEVLQWAGLRTILFLDVPSTQQLAEFADLKAFGVAGWGRSMSPEEMETDLLPVLKSLVSSESGIIHYKVCSTFDSSPDVGSIGKVLELARDSLGAQRVPIVIGAPSLGRYQVFGNLFARSGLDSAPFRLDRHPTMTRHPITPMAESDVCLHLQAQTEAAIGLVDVLLLDEPDETIRQESLARVNGDGILFDVFNAVHLLRIGQLLDQAKEQTPAMFVIGSSGVEYALTAWWEKSGLLHELQSHASGKPTFPGTDQLLVLTGSCSPVNARQISKAERAGFQLIELKTPQLINESTRQDAMVTAQESALRGLNAGKSVIMHSSLGPEDTRIAETVRELRQIGLSERDIKLKSGRILGPIFGQLLAAVLKEYPVPRVGIAGGDTSGYVARELGITALEAIAPVAPGSPLCRAFARGALDGVEMFFKGGQVGTDDVWLTMLNGTEHESAPFPSQ